MGRHGIFSAFSWTIFRAIIFAAIFNGHCQVDCVIEQSYLSPEPTARVYLFSLERGPLLTITETPNTEVVLTKPPGYFQAYMFECNATFPIQWSYVGEGAPIMTADVGRSFHNFFDPATYIYHATMVMYDLEEQNSGRYVCRGIEQRHFRISVFFHLFVPGRDILVSTAEKTVHVGLHKDQLTIPCGSSDPTSVVNLYKGNHKGTYVRLETNSSIVYNPRKGFRLERRRLLDPFGRYLCVAQTSKKRVRITVLPAGHRVKREVLTENGYSNGPARLEFSYDNHHHRMLCCSTSGFAPKVSYAGCTAIVDCEVKSACFRENKCEPRDDDSSYYNKYVGLDPPGCTGLSLRDDLNGDHGLLLCQDQIDATTQYQPFQLTRGNLYMNFEDAPPAELVMTLSRSTDEELFTGAETEFRCNSSRFFFGFGLRWAFENTGGELEFVDNADVVKDAYFLSAHRRHSILRIPHANIKSVVCVAPVWNSPTEWRIMSLPIAISRIFRPPPLENLLQAADELVPILENVPRLENVPEDVPRVEDDVHGLEHEPKLEHALKLKHVPAVHAAKVKPTKHYPSNPEYKEKLRRRIFPTRSPPRQLESFPTWDPESHGQEIGRSLYDPEDPTERVSKSKERGSKSSERLSRPTERGPVSSERGPVSSERGPMSSERVQMSSERGPVPSERASMPPKNPAAESDDDARRNDDIHKYYYDSLEDVLLGGGSLPNGQNYGELTPEEAAYGIYNSTFDLRMIL